ncbi:hypothetical protein STEG23_010339, partial [Scotinomys teguina]
VHPSPGPADANSSVVAVEFGPTYLENIAVGNGWSESPGTDEFLEEKLAPGHPLDANVPKIQKCVFLSSLEHPGLVVQATAQLEDEGKWIELKNIILCEVNQIQKDKHGMPDHEDSRSQQQNKTSGPMKATMDLRERLALSLNHPGANRTIESSDQASGYESVSTKAELFPHKEMKNLKFGGVSISFVVGRERKINSRREHFQSWTINKRSSQSIHHQKRCRHCLETLHKEAQKKALRADNAEDGN